MITGRTNEYEAQVDKTTIMKLTGHKTLEMFLRYSHLDMEHGRSAMAKLGRLMEENGSEGVDRDDTIAMTVQ